MGSIWFFVIAVHVAFVVFGGTIWYTYRKYKNVL